MPSVLSPQGAAANPIADGRAFSYGRAVHLDLHRHLEGSHSARALAKVAVEFDIRDPLFLVDQRHKTADELASDLVLHTPSDDASAFYVRINRARAAYVSDDAVVALAREAFAEAADDTDGCELRISLFSMTRTLLGAAWRDVAPSVFATRAGELLGRLLAARDAVAVEKHKTLLVRLGFSRTFESEAHYRAMADAVRSHKDALCGLDVLGIVTGVADKEPMPAALRDILLDLRRDIPDLSIHAGEFEGAASVDRTLELGVNAIGHGVRALESADTLARLRDRGVTLEVCPNSNRLLIPSTVAALQAQHGAAPLVALQRAHVHCVLGSDDPTPMGTSHTAERAYAKACGVDVDVLAADTARRWAQLPKPPAHPRPA